MKKFKEYVEEQEIKENEGGTDSSNVARVPMRAGEIVRRTNQKPVLMNQKPILMDVHGKQKKN